MNRTYILLGGLVIIVILYFIISKAGTAISKGTDTFRYETTGSPEQTAKDLMQGVVPFR